MDRDPGRFDYGLCSAERRHGSRTARRYGHSHSGNSASGNASGWRQLGACALVGQSGRRVANSQQAQPNDCETRHTGAHPHAGNAAHRAADAETSILAHQHGDGNCDGNYRSIAYACTGRRSGGSGYHRRAGLPGPVLRHLPPAQHFRNRRAIWPDARWYRHNG